MHVGVVRACPSGVCVWLALRLGLARARAKKKACANGVRPTHCPSGGKLGKAFGVHKLCVHSPVAVVPRARRHRTDRSSAPSLRSHVRCRRWPRWMGAWQVVLRAAVRRQHETRLQSRWQLFLPLARSTTLPCSISPHHPCLAAYPCPYQCPELPGLSDLMGGGRTRSCPCATWNALSKR